MVANLHTRFIPLLQSILLITLLCALSWGCSSWQPAKNVWKSTKGLWNAYVSPPASVDYEDKGSLPPEALALSSAMLGVDRELHKLERAMQNADKPPTQQWLDNLFATFPWLDGFAGVKYDGSILGQQPPESLKELDFNPLLYEDKRQNSRALRADVQPGPLGPEIMLATPLYDGVDFLGIVVAYFDMRSLMTFSDDAQNIVVLCPTALLWPGKYDFAATPLASVDWAKVVAESSAGKCSNSNGSFLYIVRYLGNLPLVFAIAENGNFPDGNGGIEQGFAFFPTQREKLPPPPLPERKPVREGEVAAFGRTEDGMEPAPAENHEETASVETEPARAHGKAAANEIQPGSRESVLLRSGRGGSGGHVQERQLEGENVEVERVQRARRPAPAPQVRPEPPMPSEMDMRPMPARPSPFGPRDEEPSTPRQEMQRPSPFGPRESVTPSIQSGETSESTDDSPLADGEDGSSPSSSAPAQSPAPQAPASDNAKPEKNLPESNAGDDDNRLADGEKAAPEPATEDNSDSGKPATLPGGRPSPFGPHK